MNPAATLVLVAGKLRMAAENASRTHPSPWVVDRQIVRSARHRIVVDRSTSRRDDALDVPFIAMMSPDAGLALADWLEDAAGGNDHDEVNPYALAVARAVLGASK